MMLVTRAQWKARSPERQLKVAMTQESTLHWNGPTVTVGGQTTWGHDKCAALVRGVQNYHMDGRGWSDIAYNFVVCPHGVIFEGRGINVVNGANGTRTGNRTSHTIMSLSGRENSFPDSEKFGILDGMQYISHKAHAPIGLKGHRDHKPTECPGEVRYGWLKQGMPVSGTPKPDPTDPTNQRTCSMEAALLLVKMHYDNARGGGKGTYDVSVSDRAGWQHWVTKLLDAHDKGTPLKSVTDNLGAQLYIEMTRNKT